MTWKDHLIGVVGLILFLFSLAALIGMLCRKKSRSCVSSTDRLSGIVELADGFSRHAISYGDLLRVSLKVLPVNNATEFMVELEVQSRTGTWTSLQATTEQGHEQFNRLVKRWRDWKVQEPSAHPMPGD